MGLVTQLLVKIEGDGRGIIATMAKTGKAGRDAFKEVSTSAKVEFEKARKEADRLFKDVTRLEKEAATHAKAGNTGLAGALSGQAASQRVEFDKASLAVIAAQQKMAAEAIKTGEITKRALAGGASGTGEKFAREGSAITRVFGSIRSEASKTGAAIKTGLSSGAFQGLGVAAAGAGAGILAGFGAAEKATIGFDKALSNVAAVSGATGKELQQLRQAALDAGAATSFSASDAARAESELAKAGLSVDDVMASLRGTLDLAAAGQIEVGEAAAIAAANMHVFGLSGDEVGHVADVLAAGANKSLASVDSLGMGLSQSALVAKQFGFSFEDTVATLSLFEDNALKGSDAGTSLKTMLLRLGAPTDMAAAAMSKLGISTYDAAGAVRPASELFEELRTSLGHVSDAQRNAALNTIFGTDAFRSASLAVKTGAGGFNDYRDAVNDAGAAGRFAGVQMDNLAGDLERLKGSLETGLIGAGSGATGVLRTMAGGAESAVNAFSALPGPVQGTVGALVGVSGATLAVGGGMAVMNPLLHKAAGGLTAVGISAERSAAGLSVLGKGFGLGASLLAIGIGADFANKKIADMTSKDVDVDKLVESFRELDKTLTDGTSGFKVSGELAEKYGDRLQGLGQDLKEFNTANTGLSKGSGWTKGLADDLLSPINAIARSSSSYKNVVKDIDAVDKAISKLLAGPPGDQNVGIRMFTDLKRNAAQLGLSEDIIAKALDDSTAAFDKNVGGLSANAQEKGRYVAVTGDAAGAEHIFKETTEATSDAAKRLAEDLNILSDRYGELTGVHVSAVQADIQFRQGLAGLSAGLKENGTSFEIATDAGQKNLTLLSGLSSQATSHASSVLEETAKTHSLADATALANAVLQQHRTDMVNVMLAQGLTREATEALINKFGLLPNQISIPFSTPGLPEAQAGLSNFSASVDAARRAAANAIVVRMELQDPFNLRFGGNLFAPPPLRLPFRGDVDRRYLGGPVDKDERYEVGEKGAELYVQRRNTPGAISSAAHLVQQADTEAREGLVRLGIPGGIEPKAVRRGTQALLLGKDGPQMFTPPTDGVVVKASDTARLLRTDDADIITRILKRAGLDKRTLDALGNAPGLVTGGRAKKGETYRVAEQGVEAWMPALGATPRSPTTPSAMPGVRRTSDGSYTFNIGGDSYTIQGNTQGSGSAVSKSEVEKLVERKKRELANELSQMLESGKR